MSRKSLVVSVGLVVGLAATLSAQGASSKGQADRKAIQSIRVKVIGCVASGPQADHYRLTNAVLSGDTNPSPVGTSGRAGSGEDLSFENSPSFDLIGGHVSAHIGHKVEIVGITSDTRLNNTDSFNSAIGSSARERATLTVRSVKMITATCP
jgi:hypothetical protein